MTTLQYHPRERQFHAKSTLRPGHIGRMTPEALRAKGGEFPNFVSECVLNPATIITLDGNSTRVH